jgi:hypothetical protein
VDSRCSVHTQTSPGRMESPSPGKMRLSASAVIVPPHCVRFVESNLLDPSTSKARVVSSTTCSMSVIVLWEIIFLASPKVRMFNVEKI